MTTEETTYATPTARVSIVQDTACSNPLEDCDHGVQFVEITRSREYHSLEKYSNTHGAGKPIDPGTLTEYREFYDEADYWHDTPRQQSPSLRAFLDRECANWGTVHRSGYDGTLTFTPSASVDDTDLDGAEAIACISRSMWREIQLIPEGKPMPKGYRERAAEMLKGVIDEYNHWAEGECYGIVTETHNSACPYCEDKEDPAHDCPCWDETDDTFYGLIGYEYAQQEQRDAVMQLAGIPIPQVTPDRKGIILARADGVPNTESPSSRTLYPEPDGQGWTVYTEHRNNPREYREGYNKHRHAQLSPAHEHNSDRVTIRFITPGTYKDDPTDCIVMHRLAWESAKDTMRHLIQSHA